MKHSKKGFTIIEVVVSLVLIGIMALVLGLGFHNMVRGYLFARDNEVLIQKGQIAMSRITQELKNIALVSSPSTSTSITFYSYKSDPTDPSIATKEKRSIRLSDDGKKVEITESYGATEYNTLTDQLAPNGFTLEYYENYGATNQCYPPSARIIVVKLRLTGPANYILELTDRVAPRNI